MNDTLSHQPWFSPLLDIRSLGQTRSKARALSELHDARREHLGQFFTPLPVVAFMWRALGHVLLRENHRTVSILDNSCGTGRMFAFADPEKHHLLGCDVHADSIAALTSAVEAAGFRADLELGGMEVCRFRGIDVALINPPFSIHLESPALESFPCCTFGKFGPSSSCVSQAYAIAQALDAASYVAAVLPRGFARTLEETPLFRNRLLAVFDLPSGTFSNEGTEVETSLAFWDAARTSSVERVKLRSLDEEVLLDFTLAPRQGTPIVRRFGLVAHEPVITRPVTGDNKVRICHHGRKILLGFNCGFTEARVRNEILVNPARICDLPDSRPPAELPFIGSARFNIDSYLLQDDPLQAFEEFFISPIRSAGGEPIPDPGLINFIQKQARKMRVHKTPFRHVIYRPQSEAVNAGRAVARKLVLTDRNNWGAPVFMAKTEVSFTRLPDNKVSVHHDRGPWITTEDEFQRNFKVLGCESSATNWEVKFEGRVKLFPGHARTIEARMRTLGIDKWLYDFQRHDVTELFMGPFGAVGALAMGLGKARIALALCLLSTAKHTLIAVEPHLVDEMVSEIRKVGIQNDQWQVIRSSEQTRSLRKINIASYARLRTPICPGQRKTYAKSLHGRIGFIVADEGHLLRNQKTEQSRALSSIGARRKIVLTGTPIANYPRNCLPLVAWVYGDGTAAQPYGFKKAFMEKRLLASCSFAARGVDRFRADFTVEEWCTNEYAEEMAEGAKREIPRIKDVPLYRDWISTLIKRRTVQEPEVAAHITIPTPLTKVHVTDFDDDHLDYYLEVAEEFRNQFMGAHRQAGKKGNINLIALLARIGAVESALNHPHDGSKHAAPYRGPSTTKQERCVELCQRFTEEGKKTIIFVQSPNSGRRLLRLLDAAGLPAVFIHGEVQQSERTRILRDEFRLGEVPLMIATKGVSRTGLNIPEASRVIFYDRAWTSSTEDQALARVLRPQQRDTVESHYLHIAGSLDEYQAQMVAHKRDAAAAALDWCAPTLADADFLHMDTILGRFVEGIGKLRTERRRGLAFPSSNGGGLHLAPN